MYTLDLSGKLVCLNIPISLTQQHWLITSGLFNSKQMGGNCANGTEITHIIFNFGSNCQKATVFTTHFSLLISTPCPIPTSVFSLPSSFWELTDERPAENTMSYTETELRLIGQHWIICIWQCCGRGFCPLQGGFDRRCLHYSILHEYTTMSRASLPSRVIKRETDRQTEALYSSNKVHLKLIKMVHKKTPALPCPNLKTPS